MTGYFVALLLACLVGSIALTIWGYQDSFLHLNAWSHPWLDAIMPHWTHLGEGVIISNLLILWLLYRHPALALSVALGMIGVALIVPLLKQGLFADWNRPAGVFPQGTFRFLSLGQERNYSFPSGHSTAAAALYAFVCAALPGKRWVGGFFWGIFALSVAWTRIYIGVHFLGDVIAGLLLGTVIAALSLHLLYPWLRERLARPGSSPWKVLRLLLSFLAGTMIIGGIWQLVQSYY